MSSIHNEPRSTAGPSPCVSGCGGADLRDGRAKAKRVRFPHRSNGTTKAALKMSNKLPAGKYYIGGPIPSGRTNPKHPKNMDTRKLDLVVGLYDEPVIIDTDSDNRDEVGRIYTTGDDEFDESDRIPFGEELVRRWNAYPEAIARIEAILNELESYGFIGERGADPDNGDTGWKWSPSIVEAKSFLESIKPQNTLDDNGKFIKA